MAEFSTPRARSIGWLSPTATTISSTARSRTSSTGTQFEALLDDNDAPTPSFVWPADRTWCVTCDVDPHFATIGGSAEAIAATLALTEIDVVVDDPDVEPPYYC